MIGRGLNPVELAFLVGLAAGGGSTELYVAGVDEIDLTGLDSRGYVHVLAQGRGYAKVILTEAGETCVEFLRPARDR